MEQGYGKKICHKQRNLSQWKYNGSNIDYVMKSGLLVKGEALWTSYKLLQLYVSSLSHGSIAGIAEKKWQFL